MQTMAAYQSYKVMLSWEGDMPMQTFEWGQQTKWGFKKQKTIYKYNNAYSYSSISKRSLENRTNAGYIKSCSIYSMKVSA